MASENKWEKPKSTLKLIIEVIEIIIIAFALSWVVRTFVLEARVVPTGSMIPTIELQDRILVDKFFYKFGEFERGDIIVFQPPTNVYTDEDFIKRIVALPGDTLEILHHKTYINGELFEEPYVYEPQIENVEPLTIPEGTVFVMGDNRNYSADSREWGLLPMENISGSALVRYWPLNRIGVLK